MIVSAKHFLQVMLLTVLPISTCFAQTDDQTRERIANLKEAIRHLEAELEVLTAKTDDNAATQQVEVPPEPMPTSRQVAPTAETVESTSDADPFATATVDRQPVAAAAVAPTPVPRAVVEEVPTIVELDPYACYDTYSAYYAPSYSAYYAPSYSAYYAPSYSAYYAPSYYRGYYAPNYLYSGYRRPYRAFDYGYDNFWGVGIGIGLYPSLGRYYGHRNHYRGHRRYRW